MTIQFQKAYEIIAKEISKEPKKSRPSFNKSIFPRKTEEAFWLPRQCREEFVRPFLENLSSLKRQNQITMRLAGAILDSGPDSPVLNETRRFLAVSSNLYRSFLTPERRARAKFPDLQPSFPPLATFGDFLNLHTLPVDYIDRLFGGKIPVTVIPYFSAKHPILWGPVSHETVGHDVLSAQEKLLPQLEQEVRLRIREKFGSDPIDPGQPLTDKQFLENLCIYALEEATSDVFAVLNSGPMYSVTTLLYSAIGNHQAFISHTQKLQKHNKTNSSLACEGIVQNGNTQPILFFDSWPDPSFNANAHINNLLVLHLSLGVIERLEHFGERTEYIKTLEALNRELETSAGIYDPKNPDALQTITFKGSFKAGNSTWITEQERKLDYRELKDYARDLGSFIATVKLEIFGGQDIQQLETWDQLDEEAAKSIAKKLQANESVTNMGDAAQLLAGGAKAIFEHENLTTSDYENITKGLNKALENSFYSDDVWGEIAAVDLKLKDETELDLFDLKGSISLTQEGKVLPKG